MCETIQRGLNNDGVLPGGLKVARKASTYWVKSKSYTDSLKSRAQIYAYALATSEENASGGIVVTAPPMRVVRRGSGSALPPGQFARFPAHPDPARPGYGGVCSATWPKPTLRSPAPRSAARARSAWHVPWPPPRHASFFGGTPSQIEYAAEMGLEHHLGLTCDPVCGLVQVPCIERNAIAAARAFDANAYATLSDGSHMVSFDRVVEVMNETGHNLPEPLPGNLRRGLARRYNGKEIIRTGFLRRGTVFFCAPGFFAIRNRESSKTQTDKHPDSE